MKKSFSVFVMIALLLGLTACGTDVHTTAGTTAAPGAAQTAAGGDIVENTLGEPLSLSGEHTRVQFTMENGDTFTMELYPEFAPKTVENFLRLVREGYYSGLTFHRVVDGFMAQGGEGETRDAIPGEFAANGYAQNTLSHQRGVVSMARTPDMNSASTQFFICYGDASFLDGNYAAFGKVIDGMQTVDDFCKVERTMGSDGAKSSPVTPIVIASAEVVQ